MVTCPFLEPIPAPMLISELNRDQISLMGDIICGQININMWTTSVKGKLEKIMFYFFLYLFGWSALPGRSLVHLSGFMSHTAIYPLHRQERIEYIKISFTEITKIRKKPRGAMPNKGFFAAQPSGAESINPGANIV